MLGKAAVGVGFMAAMAVALSKVLFACDCWYNVTFVGEEIRDSHRVLPRAIFYGTLLVTVIYILTNTAYLAVLPVDKIAAAPENRVAESMAAVLFGNLGSTLVTIAVLISAFRRHEWDDPGQRADLLCYGPRRVFFP